LSRQPAKQQHAQHDKENVWKPDEHFRMRMGISAQSVANDYK
jgi:hypothetical protein